MAKISNNTLNNTDEYNKCVENCKELFEYKDAALVECIKGCSNCAAARGLANVGELPTDVGQVRDKVQKVKKLSEILSEELENLEA